MDKIFEIIFYCNNKHSSVVHSNYYNSNGTKTSSITSVPCQIFVLVLNAAAAALFIFTQERMLKNCIWLLKHIGNFSSSELESMWKKIILETFPLF